MSRQLKVVFKKAMLIGIVARLQHREIQWRFKPSFQKLESRVRLSIHIDRPTIYVKLKNFESSITHDFCQAGSRSVYALCTKMSEVRMPTLAVGR